MKETTVRSSPAVLALMSATIVCVFVAAFHRVRGDFEVPGLLVPTTLACASIGVIKQSTRTSLVISGSTIALMVVMLILDINTGRHIVADVDGILVLFAWVVAGAYALVAITKQD
jgi:hypothetical protein